MADMRQEMAHIASVLGEAHRRYGEHVTWFEFINPTVNDIDPVYDTAPAGTGGRQYRTGVPVPVLWVIENEDERTPRPEGRQTVQSCNFTCSYRALVEAGLSQPWESTIHIRDLVYIDGRYYRLHSYVIHRGLQDEDTVVCKGHEVYIDQEMPFDPGPATPATPSYSFPATFPSLT